MVNKKLAFCILFILGSLLSLSVISAYTYSTYSSNYNNVIGIISSAGGQSLQLDESTCTQGNDFIFQISPLSCEPSVVTSDLLEEENVNVYCKMIAYKMNPFIEVNQIDAISFAKQYPREVLGIGYMPAQSALGYTRDNLDGSLLLSNMGYVVITLRRQPNESALPNCEKSIGGDICYIEGNLTATLKYDLKNSFGIGNALFYLPEVSDEEWQQDYIRYGFWDGRGYLRAKSISDDEATLALYSDNTVATNILSGQRTYKLAEYNSNIRLGVGESSNKIYLPGISPCLGSLELELLGVENPDRVAQIRIDNEYIEVKENQDFLDNKCTLRKITKNGIKQEIKISCKEDTGTKTYTLTISPEVSLKIGNADPQSYELGDFLYTTSDGRGVYLGYIGSYNNLITDDLDNIYIYLVSLNQQTEKLTDSQLNTISAFADIVSAKAGESRISGRVANFIKTAFVEVPLAVGGNIISGEKRKVLDMSAPRVDNFLGKDVTLVGFSTAENKEDLTATDESFSTYYENAMDDFDKDVNTYPTEVESQDDFQTFGERALIEEIKLAEALNQKKIMVELCKRFVQDYKDSRESLALCTNVLKIANSELAAQDVEIDNIPRTIHFDGVKDPSLEDYSVTIVVQGNNGTNTYQLRKDIPIQLKGLKKTEETTPEYITLKDLDIETAVIAVNLAGCVLNSNSKTPTTTTKSESLPLTKNYPDTECGYTFTITDIKLNKVAKVRISTNTDLARSNSTFSFKIGVEKRAIQLSPEKAQEKIMKLNNTIDTIDKINNYLDGLVKTMRIACVATEGYLTIKNALANKDGKTVARQEVMTESGGWNDKCRQLTTVDKKYKSINACFLDHSEEIEKDVNALAAVNNAQNAILNNIKEDTGITDINNVKLLSAYSEKVSSTLDSLSGKLDPDQYTAIKNALDPKNREKLLEKGTYTIDDLNDIETYSLFLLSNSDSGQVDNMVLTKLNNIISDVNAQSKNYLNLINDASGLTVNPDDVYLIGTTKENQKIYNGNTLGQAPAVEAKLSLPKNTPIALAHIDRTVYVLILEGVGSSFYVVKSTDETISGDGKQITSKKYLIYTSQGEFVTDEEIISQLKDMKFQIPATSLTNNEYLKSYGDTEPLVYYFDTPYQRLPAVVPLDLQKGWYVGVENPSTSYSSSGRIDRFWICNVGADGIESFFVANPRFGGDDCSLVDLTETRTIGSAVNGYVGVARSAIESVQNQYKAGVTRVTVPNLVMTKNHLNRIIKVGRPVTQTSSSGECTDTWSVEDCTKLFNVCDPVVCPSSRCNLGGNYYVKDVTASGIIGSVALCLPNFKLTGGDVYIPVCLSGLSAGLEGLNSVLKANSDCLQRYLDSGETVGICDEMNSIYLCELFWKEAVPIIKYFSKGLIDKFDAQKGRGGGEYSNFAAAMKNAQSSIDYFKQYYAANSYRGTGKSSTQEVSSTICGSFASLVVGNVGNFIDNLISTESPYQFIGKFQETQITTATNPPTSKYKVWYHIYAGTEVDVYYSVYLKGTGSSYYQDNANSRMVASGYIERGKYADETIDFTANSGYSKLCINVNGREECGFKEVSTSFAVNYLSDLYTSNQANNTNITTQKECTTGTASIYSVIDLNLASIIDNLANPELYTQGIIRTCASQNPGAGTDEERWKDVGYCDDKNVRCWIDINSVDDAIKALNLKDSTIDNINAAQAFLNSNYMTYEQFEANKSIIESANPIERIKLINSMLNEDRAFYNYQKAYLYFWRAEAYAELARGAYSTYLEKKAQEEAAAEAATAEENLPEIAATPNVPCAAGTDGGTIDGYHNGIPLKIRLCWIAGIDINSQVSGQLQSLINDAQSGGYDFTNSGGFRTIYEQANLYKNNCVLSTHPECDFSKNVMGYPSPQPSIQDYYANCRSIIVNSCNPETAVPGYSDHQMGLAIDFAVNGQTISATSGAFNWLSQNAYKYGLVNYPPEPWHWYFRTAEATTTVPTEVPTSGEDNIFLIQEERSILGTGLFSNLRNIYFKYENGVWMWSMGDIYHWERSSETEVTSGDYEGKSPQDTTLGVIEALDRLTENVFEEGKAIIKLNGGTTMNGLEIAVNDYVLSEYLHPEFIFASTFLHANVHVKYNKQWYYCKGDIMHVKSPCKELSNWYPVADMFSVDSGQTHDVIYDLKREGLDTKSYDEGLLYLINKAVSNDEVLSVIGEALDVDMTPSVVRPYELSAEIFSDRIFTIENPEGNSIDLVFDRIDKYWKWKPHNSNIASERMDPWTTTTVLESSLCGYCERHVGSCTNSLKRKIDNECDKSKEEVEGFEGILYELRNREDYDGAKFIFESSKEIPGYVAEYVEGQTTTSSVLEYSLTPRTEQKLATLMNTLSTSKVSIGGNTCQCGSNCNEYAQWIIDAAASNGIPDELLLLAIMIQESSCRSIASSNGEDVGLMQINLNSNCGNYGLSSTRSTCNSTLFNEETNIHVGANVLRDKYNAYKGGKVYTCGSFSKTYLGWEAAIRGYNGWGCPTTLTDDLSMGLSTDYVGQVAYKYNQLAALYK